jgi:hypothetical protein
MARQKDNTRIERVRVVDQLATALEVAASEAMVKGYGGSAVEFHDSHLRTRIESPTPAIPLPKGGLL